MKIDRVRSNHIKISAGFININAENGITLGGVMDRRESCDRADGNLEGQFSENIDNIVSAKLYKLYNNISREELHKDLCAL